MNLICIAGRPHAGKSTMIKQYIQGKKCLIFDVNNEYELTSDTTQARSRDIFLDMYKFIETAQKKINTIVVFEDATGFFRGNCKSDIIRLIQQRAHANNTYIFCFHSLRSIPPSIIDFINYLVIFKTNDTEEKVLKKFPDIISAYREIKKAPEYFHKIIKLL